MGMGGHNSFIPVCCFPVQAAASRTAEPQAHPYPKLLGGTAPGKIFVQHGSDDLNLAGLLNVLDGVVDTWAAAGVVHQPP